MTSVLAIAQASLRGTEQLLTYIIGSGGKDIAGWYICWNFMDACAATHNGYDIPFIRTRTHIHLNDWSWISCRASILGIVKLRSQRRSLGYHLTYVGTDAVAEHVISDRLTYSI